MEEPGLSDRSMAINIAFRDGTIWSVRQVIGCDVISEGRVNNCLPVPDHWELLHRNGVVVSTALTEWFERVEEYMPSVEHYGVPDQIRLGEPFAISGAGYHEGDRVELSIEFIDQSKLSLGEVPLDHGAFPLERGVPEDGPHWLRPRFHAGLRGRGRGGRLERVNHRHKIDCRRCHDSITHAGRGGIQRGRSG